MNELTALACLNLSPAELGAALRALLGQPLRRAGSFGKLCVAGALTCAGDSAKRTTALLWSSAFGAHAEVNAVLQALANGEEPMPFDFIATLPAVSAVHAAQHAPAIKFGVFMPASAEAPQTWPHLLQLALLWLDERRCDQVLCGWVEEAVPEVSNVLPASHWLALTRSGIAEAPFATLREDDSTLPGTALPGAAFIPALQTWLQHPETEFSAGTLRFSAILSN